MNYLNHWYLLLGLLVPLVSPLVLFELLELQWYKQLVPLVILLVWHCSTTGQAVLFTVFTLNGITVIATISMITIPTNDIKMVMMTM